MWFCQRRFLEQPSETLEEFPDSDCERCNLEQWNETIHTDAIIALLTERRLSLPLWLINSDLSLTCTRARIARRDGAASSDSSSVRLQREDLWFCKVTRRCHRERGRLFTVWGDSRVSPHPLLRSSELMALLFRSHGFGVPELVQIFPRTAQTDAAGLVQNRTSAAGVEDVPSRRVGVWDVPERPDRLYSSCSLDWSRCGAVPRAGRYTGTPRGPHLTAEGRSRRYIFSEIFPLCRRCFEDVRSLLGRRRDLRLCATVSSRLRIWRPSWLLDPEQQVLGTVATDLHSRRINGTFGVFSNSFPTASGRIVSSPTALDSFPLGAVTRHIISGSPITSCLPVHILTGILHNIDSEPSKSQQAWSAASANTFWASNSRRQSVVVVLSSNQQ